MDDLRIDSPVANAVARPGSVISGTASWQLDRPATSIEVRLFWYTSGKGTTDVEIVDRHTRHDPPMIGSQEFEFELPGGPYSFAGKLVALTWGIELVAEPDARATRVEFVMSPRDTAIDLYASSASK